MRRFVGRVIEKRGENDKCAMPHFTIAKVTYKEEVFHRRQMQHRHEIAKKNSLSAVLSNHLTGEPSQAAFAVVSVMFIPPKKRLLPMDVGKSIGGSFFCVYK